MLPPLFILVLLHGTFAEIPSESEILNRLDFLESEVKRNGELLQLLQSTDKNQRVWLKELDDKLQSFIYDNQQSPISSVGGRFRTEYQPQMTAVEKNPIHEHHHRSISDMTGATSGLYQRVAFTATFEQRRALTLTSSPFVFEHVLLNIRSGYNSTTGVFITPVPGVYLFSVSIISDESLDCVVELAKDGTGIAKARGNSLASRRDQGSLTAILLLDEGDKVYVHEYNSLGSPVWGDMHSTFTGVMLWALS